MQKLGYGTGVNVYLMKRYVRERRRGALLGSAARQLLPRESFVGWEVL